MKARSSAARGRSVLGVDLGGTFTKLGLVGAGGKLGKHAKLETERERGVARWVERVAEAARGLGSFSAAGVAVPGALDRKAGAVVASPNLPAWNGVPVRDALANALGVPVVLENDANAAAFGEARFGRGGEDFVLITLGTGVGGGVILDGKLVIGPGGLAGEIGHLLAEPDGRACGCGNRGCVETVASVSGMLKTVAEIGARAALRPPRDGQELAEWLKSADALRRRAASGALDRAARALGLACSQTAMLLDVRRFVFGGGGAAFLRAMEPAIRTTIGLHLYGRPLESIELVRAELENDAGMIGVAVLAGEAKARR